MKETNFRSRGEEIKEYNFSKLKIYNKEDFKSLANNKNVINNNGNINGNYPLKNKIEDLV